MSWKKSGSRLVNTDTYEAWDINSEAAAKIMAANGIEHEQLKGRGAVRPGTGSRRSTENQRRASRPALVRRNPAPVAAPEPEKIDLAAYLNEKAARQKAEGENLRMAVF